MGQKTFGIEKILVKKIWVRKFVWLKKKHVGLTQGGGYMTPPPPENSRVKFSWVFVSFVR